MSPFEFIKTINNKTENIIDKNLEDEKYYVPFYTNKAFSMFGETVLCSNMMNSLHHLSKKMQYDYYYYSVKKKNRFSKWSKPEENDIVNVISEQYKVNKSRAKEYLSLLTEDDIQTLKQMNYKGGTKN